MKNQLTGIEEAIAKASSQKAFADSLGVKQQAVSIWKLRGFVPAGRAVEIESLYGVPRIKLVNPKLRSLVSPKESDFDELAL